MNSGALGMIEVRGMLGAVGAADAALKAASVSLLRAKRVRGGLVTVFLTGDVASVRSAVDAAVASLDGMGCACTSHVIPRLSPEVLSMLVEGEGVCRNRMEQPCPAGASENTEISADGHSGGDPDTGDDREENGEDSSGLQWNGSPADLEKMTVMELRRLARAAGPGTMSKKRIRFAGKAELIRELTAFWKSRGGESE